MESTGTEHERRENRPVSRRHFLATGTAVAAGLLAGCEGDVASQEYEADLDGREFAADPVVLPEGGRDELGMTELARDSRTTTRQIDQVDGEVTITNQFSAYGRALPEDATWLERFVANAGNRSETLEDVERPGGQAGLGANPAGGALNAALGAGLPDRHGPMRSASVVPATAVGVEEIALDVFEEERTAPGTEGTVVVPGGMGASRVPSEDVLGFLNPPFTDEVTVQTGGFSVASSDWFPADPFFPDQPFSPSRWWPKNYSPDDEAFLEDGRVLLLTGDRSTEELFGTRAEEMPGERVEEGASIRTENAVLAVPGDVLDLPPSNWDGSARELYDAGFPAPLGGATYGTGVLATPNAEVAGNAANPLTDMPFEDLLTHDAVQRVLSNAGVTDAEEVEWVQSPVLQHWGGILRDEDRPVTLLGNDAEARAFAGLVSGTEHPWFVVGSIARASPDDVVIAASVQRTPAGSDEFAPGTDGTVVVPTREAVGGQNPFVQWTANGAATSATTFGAFDEP